MVSGKLASGRAERSGDNSVLFRLALRRKHQLGEITARQREQGHRCPENI
jgi:hypothetical protein